MTSAQAAGQWLKAKLPAGAKLTSDSREVRAGDGFVAFAGQRSDGRKFISAAFEAGARACVFDSLDTGLKEPERIASASNDDSLLAVEGLRSNAGVVASYFYGEPSKSIAVIAVTGTNGKTSCSHWIAQGLAPASGCEKTGIVGTLGSGFVDAAGNAELSDFGMTTPDAVTLQHHLSHMLKLGSRHVVMEASSIGIAQKRLEGTEISVAVFTNLSRDHLDFHGSMAAYGEAKAELFSSPSLQVAVVNLNDAASALMLSRLALLKPCLAIGYGLESQALIAPNVDRKVLARDLQVSEKGTAFVLDSDWGVAHIQLQLHGQFNVANAIAVAATLLGMGIDFETVCHKLAQFVPIPGRLQKVAADSAAGREDLCVFVDYAHTPDALSKSLDALIALAQQRGGRLWCVFGAGGDRDPGKRPMLAAAAQLKAQHIVVTSDNPRSESPQAIIDQVMAGFTSVPLNVTAIVDREQAIQYAVRGASAKDVLLVAGKGHEAYQEVAGVKHPFSDVAQVRKALALRATYRAMGAV